METNGFFIKNLLQLDRSLHSSAQRGTLWTPVTPNVAEPFLWPR